jgi:hypothetical protein
MKDSFFFLSFLHDNSCQVNKPSLFFHLTIINTLFDFVIVLLQKVLLKKIDIDCSLVL